MIVVDHSLDLKTITENKKSDINRILNRLMLLPNETIEEKFSDDRRTKLLGYIKNLANREAIEERHLHLSGFAKKRSSPTVKMLVNIVVLVIGSVVYCNTVRIYTASFGAFAWPAALFVGFAASVGVDYLATRACSKYINRQVTRKALNKLERQKDEYLKNNEGNIFSESFWQDKIDYIHSVEGGALSSSYQVKILGKIFSTYALFAFVLNIIEFIGAFYLVSRLGLLEGLNIFIRVVISSLPVVLTWMFAYVQAEWFYRPEYIRDLLRKYHKHHEEISNKPIDNVHRALVSLDAGVSVLLKPKSKHQTVEIAELDSEIKCLRSDIHALMSSRKVRRQSIEEQYEQEKIQEQKEYPEFKNPKEETDFEISIKRKKYEQDKSKYLTEKIEEIDNNKAASLEKYEKEYEKELNNLRYLLKTTNLEYRKAKKDFDSHPSNNIT